jgi:hypothetical protein
MTTPVYFRKWYHFRETAEPERGLHSTASRSLINLKSCGYARNVELCENNAPESFPTHDHPSGKVPEITQHGCLPVGSEELM